jgi:hypothetical protein
MSLTETVGLVGVVAASVIKEGRSAMGSYGAR